MKSGRQVLANVWTTYETTKQCIKIVDRLGPTAKRGAPEPVAWQGLTAVEASRLLQTCRNESENFAILALWAVFERFIIDYVREKASAISGTGPEAFSRSLQGRFEASVENWRMDDILDLFKGTVGSRLLGDAKNVKRYRDWVAHRNERRGHNGRTDPKFAYHCLSRIIDAIVAAEQSRNTP